MLLGLALAPRGASAQDRPSVRVDLQGSPPEALVSVRNLLEERRFLGALESGFPLYMEYKVTLRAPRSFRDARLGESSWEYVVLYDPLRERYTVETPDGTESISDRSALRERLAQVYLVGLVDPGDRGDLYYEAEVNARTLSDQDVDEAFAWLRGESGDSARMRHPGLFDRLARRVLVEVAPLPRLRLNGRSQAFQVK